MSTCRSSRDVSSPTVVASHEVNRLCQDKLKLEMRRIFMRAVAAFVALCSSHARHAVGFQLDTNTGGVVGRSEGVVRFGARIEVSQEHTSSAERREIFDKISYAVGFGALSTLSCAFGPFPSLAEVDLETDFGHDTSSNPKTISSASNTPGNEPASVVECDEDCKEQRRKMIEDRRAMMRQSRSTSSRQEVFELSKQRARMYGSDYKGTSCIDGIPCI